MDPNFYDLIIACIIFIPTSGLVAWIVTMESERFFQRIDQKIADEIRRRCNINGIVIEQPLMPDVTYIRHECKKENRYIFFIIICASLISFLGGAVSILMFP